MRGGFAAVGCGGCWNKECTSWFPYVRARLPLRTDLIRGASAFSDGAGHRGQGEDASASVTMDRGSLGTETPEGWQGETNSAVPDWGGMG